MTRIKDLKDHENHVVEGQYLLCEVADRQTQHGDRFKALRLADCTGELPVYLWESSGLMERAPVTTPSRIQAGLYVRQLNGKLIADLQQLHALDTHEIVNAAALLPFSDCPDCARPALQKLVNFIDELEPRALRDFLNRALLDDRIANGLLTCRGSQKHHHSEPGGLLAHSVEVMVIAADMAGDRLSALERAIIQVAALFHDIGKLRAVGSGRVRPIHYKLVSHETQTHRLLEPHLEWLRGRAPDIAVGCDYCFGYLSQRRSDRSFAQFVGAELIAAADQMSAALSNNRRLDDLLKKTLPASQCRALAQSTKQDSQVPRGRLHGEQR